MLRKSVNSQLYCNQLNEIKVHKNHLNDSNSHFSQAESSPTAQQLSVRPRRAV